MASYRKPYPFDQIEPAWQAHWEHHETFHTPNPGDASFDPSKPKFYVLDMFPYPSGAGLHVGHPEGYTATDILGRTRRMQGYNVLHPMGWDAFGLPAEQYAIKTGRHPRLTTQENVDNFRRQLKSLGFAYDWQREVNTTDPGYIRWTQWIFLQLYHSYVDPDSGRARPVAELEQRGWSREQIDAVRLAYVAEVPVNWSPDLGTVLANEEVEEWQAKGHKVERRPLRQWMLRITALAERLIGDLDHLDWPESIKLLQRNWIGRSEGAEVRFQISDGKYQIEVFTTRPDTLFGASYMVLAPEHPLVPAITTSEQADSVAAYQENCGSKSDLERTDLAKDKTGVFTGAYAVNPVNEERIPIWIADYVLMSYGTGAIMAVPAHDERDFEFATKYDLPIKAVVAPPGSVGVSPTEPEQPPSHPFQDPFEKTAKHTPLTLPHWQQQAKTYFVTWRLADSLPQEKLAHWRGERDAWLVDHPKPWDDTTLEQYHSLFGDKIDAWLDEGRGACILKDPRIAKIVADALQHFDGDRYHLDSFVVMPNHVHVLFQLAPEQKLEDVIHSWKSFTAKEINRIREASGEVWQRDYWDRMIRDNAHFANMKGYIGNNPSRAGLEQGSYVVWERHGDGHVGETPTLPDLPFCEPGVSVNSDFLDGLETAEARVRMIDWLEEHDIGRRRIQYKLRDWLFSRQRYWGEPFPIVWDQQARHQAIAEDQLPLLQPELEDFKPTGDPRGPLVKAVDWIRYSDTLERETNTMPQWAGSCWYYLRYLDPDNNQRFVSSEAERYWMGADANDKPLRGGVDLYVGGTEHAVLHLLYARFWHKVLFDLGHISTAEPFQRLVNQGLILGEDGQKMSKSVGNVINPDDVVHQYGADSLRLYEMFMGPLEQVKPWSMKGVEGVHRFLARVWRVCLQQDQEENWHISGKLVDTSDETDPALRKVVHETIRKVSEDIDKLGFNTAISELMKCTNAFTQAGHVPVMLLADFLKLLSPFAPHVAEELWQRLNSAFPAIAAAPATGAAEANAGLVSEQPWPRHNPEYLIESEIELVLQVNGKTRDRIRVPADADREQIEAMAAGTDKVKQHTEGLTVRKIIVVPGRLVNVVAN